MKLDARFDGAALGLAIGVGLLCAVAAWCSCTSVGALVCPAHASLCDPQDFDPKCVLDKCGDADGGPR